MASADSYAIELPPVPAQPLEGVDAGMIPLFDDELLGGLVPGQSFSNSPEDGATPASLSPSGYSPTHGVPSPQAHEMQGPMESSSDELGHLRGGIIQKLPNKKRTGVYHSRSCMPLILSAQDSKMSASSSRMTALALVSCRTMSATKSASAA